MEEHSSLRVVSFNVNGLRAALKRKFGSVAELLQAVNADILCIQETKLRRCDVERDLAVVEGWDAFFACAQSPKGYSGTATYVRTSLTLPCAAEEGFSGLCASNAAPSATVGAGASIHPALAEAFTVEELQELDSEGRVVITDHGAFVLFNIYGPALTSEDPDTHEQRLAFKLRFYQALQLRWEDYLGKGRAVVAVGDLNICPAPLDTVDPKPNFYQDSRPDRQWLQNLLVPVAEGLVPSALAASGGAATAAPEAAVAGAAGSVAAGRFTDVFRVFHPRRQGAYTCWRTATSARVNNYGARIDLVLSAGLTVSATPPPAAPAPDFIAAAGQQGGPMVAFAPPSALRSLFLGRGPAGTTAAADAVAAGPHLGRGFAGGAPGGTTQRQVVNATDSSSCGGVYGSGSGRGGTDCQVWLSASDIQADMDGSDHCPVWVDVSYRGRFPCAEVPPPSAARHHFTGKQLKLHSWLMRGGAAAAPTAAQQGSAGWALDSSDSQLLDRIGEEGSTGASLSTEPSRELGLGSSRQQSPYASTSLQAPQRQSTGQGALGGTTSGVAAVGTKRLGTSRANPASKKQASLRGFFARPSGSGMQQAQQAPQQGQQPPGLDKLGSGSAAAAVQAQGIGLPAEPSLAPGTEKGLPAIGGSSACGLSVGSAAVAAPRSEAAPEPLWDSQGGGSQPEPGGSLAGTMEAAGAWRRIQEQMAVPRCLHGEPAALKRVNKSGPNHGRYFYVCQRPDGPKPEGQCSFFQWVKKRSGDHPYTLAGAKNASVIGNRSKP